MSDPMSEATEMMIDSVTEEIIDQKELAEQLLAWSPLRGHQSSRFRRTAARAASRFTALMAESGIPAGQTSAHSP